MTGAFRPGTHFPDFSVVLPLQGLGGAGRELGAGRYRSKP